MKNPSIFQERLCLFSTNLPSPNEVLLLPAEPISKNLESNANTSRRSCPEIFVVGSFSHEIHLVRFLKSVRRAFEKANPIRCKTLPVSDGNP